MLLQQQLLLKEAVVAVIFQALSLPLSLGGPFRTSVSPLVLPAFTLMEWVTRMISLKGGPLPHGSVHGGAGDSAQPTFSPGWAGSARQAGAGQVFN